MAEPLREETQRLQSQTGRDAPGQEEGPQSGPSDPSDVARAVSIDMESAFFLLCDAFSTVNRTHFT
jgi:hypothetical protein